MQNLSNFLFEALSLTKTKPLGYVDESEFASDKYKDYKYTLLQCIAKHTPLKRNSFSNGDLWEEYFLEDNFKLLSKKKTTIGKTERKIKTKVLSKREVSSNKKEILEILFGKDVEENIYDSFESLVNFIVSTEYINRDRVGKIFKSFINKCEGSNLSTKMYKIKPWIKSKYETIV